MAKISVSYQPNKIKKPTYTNWIDGGKFCTTSNPAGTTTAPTSGLNLIDAFDVDWSAYLIDNQPASASKIIERINSSVTGSYLPLAGGTMQGNLNMSNSSIIWGGGDSDEGPSVELSINSEGALKISNSTNIQGGLHSTASATYSNVLLGVNNPGANETGFTDMGTDTMANGYPLVISTVDSKDGACLVFGPGDIYALKKNSAGTGYQSSTLCLQHRSDYYGDVLIGKNLQVGDINSYGGTGGNLTVKGYAEAKDGFKKTGSTNDYVLLAGGGTALISSIQGSGGTVTSITPGTGLTGASNNDSAITTSGTINLKSAGTSEIGGIKVKTVNTNAVTSATEGTNYYPVNIDSNGLGYVALPTFKTSDNNTTYTFKSGTNGFTVTPFGGTAQTVTVTPSITNNITGSGTSGYLAKFNGTNTLTSGPQLGSDTTKFLRNDGTWAVPPGTGITGDYLPLAGGTMTGTIGFNWGNSDIHTLLESNGHYILQFDDSTDQDELRLGVDTSLPVTIYKLISQAEIITPKIKGGSGAQLTFGTSTITSSGSITAPAFFESSDIRKKDIKSDISLDKCYDLIDKCQTIIYSLKSEDKEQMGMIAQEVEEFFPEVVATDADGFKSLAYDRLVVICFKVLKDVIQRLEKLEHE